MPGENIWDWSSVAADNAGADSLINWAEGQARASVNNSARSMMAAHAKDRNLHNGSIVTAGTANAQTFASGYSPVFTTVPTGFYCRLKIGVGLTPTASFTLSMDGITPSVVFDNHGFPAGAGAIAAGSYFEFLFDGTNWRIVSPDLGAAVPQCGILKFVSTTQLSYLPFNGDRLKVNGQVYQIPVTGIAGLANTNVWVNNIAAQNLVANTLYLVFVKSDGAGGLVADFHTGGVGHKPSPSAGNVGVEVITDGVGTPNDSFSLIGMIRTSATATFLDDPQKRFTLSWFNRQPKAVVGAVFSIPGIGAVYPNVGGPVTEFLSWAGGVAVSIEGNVVATGAGNTTIYFNVCLDGLVANSLSPTPGNYAQLPSVQYSMGSTGSFTVTEGYHFWQTVFGVTNDSATVGGSFHGMVFG